MIYKKKVYEPEAILRSLDLHFKENLTALEGESDSVGYNVSVVVTDKEKQYVSFSGANQNLLYLDANNDIEIAEGGPDSIGAGDGEKKFGSFAGTFAEVKAIYLAGVSTEGQIAGGVRKSSLVEIIDDISDRNFKEQLEELKISLAESMSGSLQRYDVMVVGAKL